MNPHPYDQALSDLQNDNIFFVSVGAMDGVAHDDLYPHAFKNKHWSGLLVEPVKHYFDQLKNNYENRNNLIFKNVAITDKQETKDIYTIPKQYIEKGLVPYWCNGISTFHQKRSAISYDGIKDKITTELVVCCSFKDLVNEHNITNIDVLQIDAEGCDYDIFQQVWSAGFRPKIVHIEFVHMLNTELDQLKKQLIQCGYAINIFGDNLTATKTIVTTFSKRKRVAFYTYPQWAFGAIHSALCKELYPYNIDADILDWNGTYSNEDWKDFNKLYDVFVTVPGKATQWLLDNNIPYEKIIAIAHGQYDFKAGLNYKNDYNAFRAVAGVAQSLKPFAKTIGIDREIQVVRNGIHFDRFYRAPAKTFIRLGYGSTLKFYESDVKRSHLVQKISQILQMPLFIAKKQHFVCMPEFYENIDCLMVTSNTEEACSLPLMEAAAAGRLPMSAKIGIASEFDNPPGVIIALDENAFVQEAITHILELQANSGKFNLLCKEAQEFAYNHYDWKHVIKSWIKVLNG